MLCQCHVRLISIWNVTLHTRHLMAPTLVTGLLQHSKEINSGRAVRQSPAPVTSTAHCMRGCAVACCAADSLHSTVLAWLQNMQSNWVGTDAALFVITRACKVHSMA